MGFFFLISFLELSLYYIETQLTLYPATFQICLLVITGFCGIFKFSMYKIISFSNRGNFTSSFPIQMPFMSLSCLTAQTRTSSTIWNRRGKNGHPYIITDLREAAFSISPLSRMLAVAFPHMVLIML